jgi:hypothetical protein
VPGAVPVLAVRDKFVVEGDDGQTAFEEVALSINDLVCVASATRFPALSFTPISVYRIW